MITGDEKTGSMSIFTTEKTAPQIEYVQELILYGQFPVFIVYLKY